MINLKLIKGIGDEELDDWLAMQATHVEDRRTRLKRAGEALRVSLKNYEAIRLEYTSRAGLTDTFAGASGKVKQ